MAKKRKVVPAFTEKSFEKETADMLTNLLKRESKNLYSTLSKGGTRSDLLERVSALSDLAENYTATYVDTGLSIVGRKRLEEVAQDLGLNWYNYIGGTIAKTREFCEERNGGYFTREEVESWADEDWDGKIEGTDEENIFEYCGGWNCRHTLVPVDESIVPEDVVKANANAREVSKLTIERLQRDAKFTESEVKEQTAREAVQLTELAQSVGNELDEAARKIVRQNAGTTVTDLNYKSIESIIRKSETELDGYIFGDRGVKDPVRNTIITDKDSLKNVAAQLKKDQITKRFKVQDFSESSGYRGYLQNSKLSNGTWAETQVNTAEMIFAKESPNNAKRVIGEAKWNAIKKKTGLEGGLGHKYYEEIRKLKPSDYVKREALEKKSREYYSKFYYSYPADWKKL